MNRPTIGSEDHLWLSLQIRPLILLVKTNKTIRSLKSLLHLRCDIFYSSPRLFIQSSDNDDRVTTPGVDFTFTLPLLAKLYKKTKTVKTKPLNHSFTCVSLINRSPTLLGQFFRTLGLVPLLQSIFPLIKVPIISPS